MNLPGGWAEQSGTTIAALSLVSEEPSAPRKEGGHYVTSRTDAITAG